jgi:hypothetical protein
MDGLTDGEEASKLPSVVKSFARKRVEVNEDNKARWLRGGLC